MRRTTAIAWMSGLITGIVTTAVATALLGAHVDQRFLILVALNVLPAGMFTVGGLVMGRRWMRAHTEQIRANEASAANTRDLFLRELAARQKDIAAREEALAKAVKASDQRATEVVERFRAQLASAADLKTAYDELLLDYNKVVMDQLQQSADLFRPREAGSSTGRRAPLLPMPARRHPDSGEVAHHQAHDLADPSVSS